MAKQCRISPLTKGGNCDKLYSEDSFLHNFFSYHSQSLSPSTKFPLWCLYKGSSDLKWNCFILSLYSIWLGVETCCVTCISKSAQSEHWEGMVRSRSDGDTQGWSWICSFSISQAIQTGQALTTLDSHNDVINFVYSLVWTFHRTMESLNQLGWNRPQDVFQSAQSGVKGTTKGPFGWMCAKGL